MFLRKLKKNKYVDSLDRPIRNGKDDNIDIKLEDTIIGDTDIEVDYDKLETYEIIREIVSNLPLVIKKSLHFILDLMIIYLINKKKLLIY